MKKEDILFFLEKYKWFLFIILVIVSSFYWLQVRPALIKKDCYSTVADVMKKNGSPTVEQYNILYKMCLNSKGL